MKNTLLAIALPLGSALFQAIPLPAVGADVNEAWVARYNNVLSNATGISSKIVRDEAGDVIVAGYAGDGVGGLDMMTIKYSGVDGSVLWQHRYNGPANGNDVVEALAVDSQGNVVVAGSSYAGMDTNSYHLYDYYTAKYASADGALLWEKRYRDPDHLYLSTSITALAVDQNGNVVIAGIGRTTKFAGADGHMVWTRRYFDPEFSYSGASITALTLDGSGNALVRGDRSVAKLAAADGNLLWERVYTSDMKIVTSVVDGSGDVFVAGSRSNTWYAAKYAAANGTLLRERVGSGFTMAYGSDAITAMALDSRGNVVVTGYSTTGFKAWGWPVYTEYYTAKYAAGTGALLWSRICPLWRAATFDANDNVITDRWGDYAKYAAADGALLAEYQFAFAGSANVWDGSGNVVVTGGRFETAKYVAATGAELWRQQFKGPANLADIAQAVAVDGNGNVVVTGYSVGFTNDLESLDYYTAKYAAASGALLWERRYNGPANHDDRPVAMAVDGVGNVVVTGWENNYSSNYTAKYASADGALIWEKRGRVTATGLAVDRGGNVVLTGTYAVDGGLNDFFAAKYAGADGAVLWEKRYHDRADSAYNAAAAAVDGNGDVIVTGPGRTVKFGAAEGTLLWERPTPFNALAIAVDGGGNVAVCGFYATDLNTGQYVTAKYAGADGALLWERHYHGPSDYSRDQATSVAMDGRGDVVVTGYSQSVPGDSNVCYTAKYAAADGALLWEKRSPIEASAVAVDGKGDVILAGTAGLTDNTFDYYIAKYGTATGALLWEKRYNGPANGYDFTRALHPLALGPNGMVAVTGSSYPGPDYATVVYREELPVSLSVRSSANALILSWPTNATGFTLQSTPSLTPPVTWLYVTNPPAVLGGLFTVTNPVSGDSQFFRLKK